MNIRKFETSNIYLYALKKKKKTLLFIYCLRKYSASDGTPLSLYDVCRFLSKQQWKHILKQLKQEGIHIERIEAYEYPEVRDIKHLFIRFEKEKEDTPFYLLSPEIFSKLTNAIIQEYSSNIK